MNFKPDKNFDADESRTPINLLADDDTGFLIVQLKEGITNGDHSDLRIAALETGRIDMHETLNSFDITGKPLVRAIPFQRLRELERLLPPAEDEVQHDLSNYWRIDARQSPEKLDQIEQSLKQLPEVELVYREKIVTDPVNPNDDPFFPLQGYLHQQGVNAASGWNFLTGANPALHFIDLEQGWIRDHEDLPQTELIYNNNRDGYGGYVGNHGCAVVGIVSAADNTKGVIGIEPNPTSVRLVSYWNKTTGDTVIADAIVAAITKPPLPHVLLIEAQIGKHKRPVEVASATFKAIRLATASGVIVVEPAGNGNRSLNGLLHAGDSGAILVGAGDAAPPHNRGIWNDGQGSNYGARVNCYAWGNGITAPGYGGLQSLGATQNYTGNFGGTSGAAAIIAGCALLLQRLRVASSGNYLTPAEMRALLSNPATGTPQGGGVTGHIGVMPDLGAIIKSRPDLFPGISPEIEMANLHNA